MSAEVPQNDGVEKVEELLDGHQEVESYSWKQRHEEVYVVLSEGKLAGRAFIDDMGEAGMTVEFVDFATDRIGFSRE